MKKYPKMKDSGIEWIGKIPEEWEVKKLKFLSRISSSNIGKKQHEELKLKIIHYNDVIKNNIIEQNNQLDYGYCSKLQYQSFNVKKDDIIITKDSMDVSNIGDVCLINKKLENTVFGYHLSKISIKSDILPKYLFYFLNQQQIKDHFLVESRGVTIIGIGREAMMNTFVTIPTEEEQKIVKFLENELLKIDSSIFKNQKLIKFLEGKKLGTINHVMTKGIDSSAIMKDSGIEWIGKIPELWNVNYLKYIMNDMVAGPFGSSIKKEEYVEAGYKVYGQEQVIPNDFSIGDYYISENKFQELKRFKIHSDDILISCVGTFGKIAIVPKEIESGIINPRLIKLTPNNKLIHSEYLFEFLKSNFAFSQLEKYSRGGTMDIINLGLLSSIMLPIPPLNEQKSIIIFLKNKIDNIEKLKIRTKIQIEKLQEFRKSLISSTITGKIDVREAIA